MAAHPHHPGWSGSDQTSLDEYLDDEFLVFNFDPGVFLTCSLSPLFKLFSLLNFQDFKPESSENPHQLGSLNLGT